MTAMLEPDVGAVRTSKGAFGEELPKLRWMNQAKNVEREDVRKFLNISDSNPRLSSKRIAPLKAKGRRQRQKEKGKKQKLILSLETI